MEKFWTSRVCQIHILHRRLIVIDVFIVILDIEADSSDKMPTQGMAEAFFHVVEDSVI